jgi:hypothetical protein
MSDAVGERSVEQRHGESGLLGQLPHACLSCIWSSLGVYNRKNLMVTSKAAQALFAEVVTSLRLDLDKAAQQGPVQALLKRLHPGVKPKRLTLECNFSNAWREAFSAVAGNPQFHEVTHLEISLVSLSESTATNQHSVRITCFLRCFLCLPSSLLQCHWTAELADIMKPLYSHLVELNLTGCTIGRGSLTWLTAVDNLQLLNLSGSHLNGSDASNLRFIQLDHDAAQVRSTLAKSTSP